MQSIIPLKLSHHMQTNNAHLKAMPTAAVMLASTISTCLVEYQCYQLPVKTQVNDRYFTLTFVLFYLAFVCSCLTVCVCVSSGYRPDLPWQTSALSHCSCVLLYVCVLAVDTDQVCLGRRLRCLTALVNRFLPVSHQC